MSNFKCDMCGLCCQSVGKSDIYRHLDRGDGICRDYDETTHRCKIYLSRPLLCNIDGFYDANLKDEMSREEFHRQNYEACRLLKKDMTYMTATKTEREGEGKVVVVIG